MFTRPFRTLLLLLILVPVACQAPDTRFSAEERARWEERSESVSITRDDWGIPHIEGETDADAVFGMIYAQAEDDFNRIEVNFLNAMGRLAEAEGERALYRDLRMRLFIHEDDLKAMYAESPAWLRDLMDAWADGLNHYLATHPETEPRVLDRFEPWMALSFSEGSIGGDIERVRLSDVESFYGEGRPGALAQNGGSGDVFLEPTGSNGFAIAPANTQSGNSLLLINPHTSFYFRAEVHVRSNEGLNAYGAVTWGQFFVYQGFNDKVGWMHTSSRADNIDEYLLDVVEREDGMYYVFDGEERPLAARDVTIRVREEGGSFRERVFTTYRSHHGPVIREQDGKWVAFRIMEEPLKALQQSYLRTKAQNFDDYVETMRLHTNSSNNTVYADADGTIAYFHSNHIPIKDASYDWTRPVDGTTSATDWQGIYPVEESILILNPPNGWIQNTNNWPFSAAGAYSPKKEDYPAYMSQNPENARGINAVRVLEGVDDFTIASLRAAAYDPTMTAFEELLPPLFEAWDELPAADPLKEATREQVRVLKDWDMDWSVESVPTSVAIFWATEFRRNNDGEAAPRARVEALEVASRTLEEDFGSWQTPWGDINRFQRLTGDIVQPFDDNEPSIPVGFASSRWGSLAAYGQRTFNDTKKIYGTRGNSFVAIVEFADSVQAVAITAGGQSGDPASPHFNDQAELYARGELRPVYFYPDAIRLAAEETYTPGTRR